MAAALVATPALSEQLALLLDAVPRIAGADTATIYLRDDTTGAWEVVARYGYRTTRSASGPRHGGLTEHVLSTGDVLIVDDASADPRVSQAVIAAGIRSFVALPLLVRRPRAIPVVPAPGAAAPGDADTPGAPGAPGTLYAPGPRSAETGAPDLGASEAAPSPDEQALQPIGVLYVNARRPRAFGAETVELLKGLAALAAVAIENGHLLAAQRAAAVRLTEALALREQFVSVASHELRTPLTPLKGYVQSIQRRFERAAALGQPVDATWLRRALRVMEEQVNRLNDLVGDLLDVSRLRSGRFLVAPETLDLVKLARETFARFRDALASETESIEDDLQPTLHFRAGEGALTGQWDRNRLDQLITNLLGNAVKYSPNGGTVELRVEPVDPADASFETYRRRAPDVAAGWVHLAVRDQGIGLPAEEAAQRALFQAFTRGENAPAERFGGFGLGLFICAEIVHRHGGAIWAESAGPGTGAVFHVLLPPRPPATVAEAASVATHPAA